MNTYSIKAWLDDGTELQIEVRAKGMIMAWNKAVRALKKNHPGTHGQIIEMAVKG